MSKIRCISEHLVDPTPKLLPISFEILVFHFIYHSVLTDYNFLNKDTIFLDKYLPNATLEYRKCALIIFISLIPSIFGD
jgi:hypothetical protein